MSSEGEIRAAIALLERRLSNDSTVYVGDGQRYGNALLTLMLALAHPTQWPHARFCTSPYIRSGEGGALDFHYS